MPSTTSRELSAFLDSLIAGNRSAASELTILSDLDRTEAAQLREAWPAVPGPVREHLLGLAVELAEDNVDLSFVALAKVALNDSLATVRQRAAEALWETEDRAVAAALRERLLDDPDRSVREAAAQSLAHFVLMREVGLFDPVEGDAVVAALRETAIDTTQPIGVRALAVEALGLRSLPWVTGLITDAYDSEDRRMRIAALHAMGGSADERWLEYIHEQFYSDDSEFRFEAVVAAGGVASEDSVEPLLPLLDDDDSQVIIATVEALGEISGEQALEALKEFQKRAPEGMEEIVTIAIEMAVEGGIEVVQDEEDEEW